MQIVPLDVPLELLGTRSHPPQQHYYGHTVFASAKRGILGLGSRVPKEGATNSLGVKEKGVEGWGRGDRGEEEPVGSGWRDVEEEKDRGFNSPI